MCVRVSQTWAGWAALWGLAETQPWASHHTRFQWGPAALESPGSPVGFLLSTGLAVATLRGYSVSMLLSAR